MLLKGHGASQVKIMEFKKLNNNEKLPFVSFGVYEIEPEKTKNAVLNALERGYPAIDCAQVYYNEKQVGNKGG